MKVKCINSLPLNFQEEAQLSIIFKEMEFLPIYSTVLNLRTMVVYQLQASSPNDFIQKLTTILENNPQQSNSTLITGDVHIDLYLNKHYA